ncbi:MAG: hypothetical protein HY553_07205 [Elusimicrobia bacterium]|nr:hypothetical protein [Elusimicrobiota bacterium]
MPAKTGGRERLVASGRHTGGLEKSQGVKNLLGMARSMQGDKSGSEGGSSRQTLGFDSTQPIGNQLGLALPGGRGPHDGGRTSGGGTGGGSAGETGPVWRETEGLDQDTLTDPEVPEVGPTKNVTPYQWAIDTAKFIMAAIMALAIASAIAKKTKVGIGALKVIYKLTAALGAILGVLGCYMIAQGQYLQGTIWTVLGAVTAVIALKNLDETGKAPEQASKEAIEDKGREVAKKWEGAHEGQTEWGKAANQNTPDTFRQFTDNTGKYTQSFNSKTGELTSTFTDKAGNTWKWVRTDMPYAPQRSGFLGHFVSGTYQTTATNVVGSFVPAATGGGSFATLALTGTALGHEINEERNRKKDDNRERREKYVREQGVDPDTKRIVDRKTFEKLHGRGSAERYEKKHGFDDPNQRRMRYIEKTGIDPETNLVVDKEVFEARYGKGAADKWNEDHKDLDA